MHTCRDPRKRAAGMTDKTEIRESAGSVTMSCGVWRPTLLPTAHS